MSKATTSLPAALANHDPATVTENARKRKRFSRMFFWLCVAIAWVSVVVLVVLLVSIGAQGYGSLSSDLVQNSHSELEPERSGMRPAVIGSLFVCGSCALAALPLGVGTAIFFGRV